jgi:chorismate mutase
MSISQSCLIKTSKPFIVAGPCSAESMQQVRETAREILANTPSVQWFRAGVWKPRTRPSDFEGMGLKALEWLSKIKSETGLNVCTEVVKPSHIELCLKYGIAGLWIGARTTTNPVLIQELACCLQSLGATNLPVFIKNPLNPDVNLWIGAMERLYNAGCKEIIAVHRGFSLMNSGKYRQSPLWQIPIELKRLLPDIFMLCDPSHIAGKREYIMEIAQMAMNLNFDGLFIETHCNPQIAQTDSNQQITPSELKLLLNRLIIPSQQNRYLESVTAIREKIDLIDYDLIELLQKRMSLSENLALIKRNENLSPYQPKRWAEVLNNRIEQGINMGLSERFVKTVFEQIHEESIKIQSNKMNQ